jgi:hypothetical protein
MLKRSLGVLGALGGWFLVIEPPRRQGRQAIGENNRPNCDSACHSIHRSSNPYKNFCAFSCGSWLKNPIRTRFNQGFYGDARGSAQRLFVRVPCWLCWHFAHTIFPARTVSYRLVPGRVPSSGTFPPRRHDQTGTV